MALTDDKELDVLHKDWLSKTRVAALADAALQDAVKDVPRLREEAQEAARAARAAGVDLHDRVFSSDGKDGDDWRRVAGDAIAEDFRPERLADKVEAVVKEQMEAVAEEKSVAEDELAEAVEAERKEG